MSEHPIRKPEVQLAIERWTALVLGPTGTATITIELDFKDGLFRGIRVGGSTSQIRCESQGLTRKVV